MIVKERELVLVIAGRNTWIGDTNIVAEGALSGDEYFKVRHQLVCSECHRGVRAQDDHHCEDPD